jgi:hypothetical protein
MGEEEGLEINDVLSWDDDFFVVEGLRPDLQELFTPGRTFPPVILITRDGEERRHLRRVFVTMMQTRFRRVGDTTNQWTPGRVETTFLFEADEQ